MENSEPTEREWTDKFGTHYEVRGKNAEGRIFSLKVTRNAIGGWPGRRKTAFAEVKAAMMRSAFRSA